MEKILSLIRQLESELSELRTQLDDSDATHYGKYHRLIEQIREKEKERENLKRLTEDAEVSA
jgi:tRNA isopentenyl-2-thiomethyl-A-37 hydroxylase MiaE